MKTDYFYMKQALMLAKRGSLTVSPNPMVGCIIVKNGKIIGEGFHHHKGGKHAEIKALNIASKNARNATVYVTLEPCSYTSNTTACANALVKAKVKRVVIASVDPNRKVCQNGIKFLKRNGIDITVGILEKDAQELNKFFFYYQIFSLPYIVAKWGMSLDGRIKTVIGDSNTITNVGTQTLVHNIRNRCDGIMIGINTVIKDNPSLTARLSNASIIKNPIKIIISKEFSVNHKMKILDLAEGNTILFTTKLVKEFQVELMKRKGVECIIMPTIDVNHKISLLSILKILAKKGVTSILLEGGDNLHNCFLKSKLVNEVKSFISPVIVGNLIKKFNVDNFSLKVINKEMQICASLIKFLN